jgi:hypothetical protein
MPSALATLLLLVTFAAAQTSPPPNEQAVGTITGVVTNNEGDPIEGATLCTTFWSATGSSTSCGGAQSGKGGQFELHVPLGEVGVYAEKQVGGYFPVMDDSPTHMKGIRKLTLTSQSPTAKVMLKIGPRPGELKFDVKDKSTGKAVEGYGVRWIAMDNSRLISIDIPGTGTLIPPEIDVIVEVHADGYRRWFYIDPSNPSQPILRVAPGEEKHLEVELEPVEKN